MKPLMIISAGGTIDALEYDFETGNVISFAKPAVIEILEKVMSLQDITFCSPFQKDSDMMTDQDREELLAICQRSSSNHIVITHGTGTMIDTGLLLEKHLRDKIIVLTGSLPYTYDASYAAFNLGNAVLACQLLQPGVYIATSGEIVALGSSEIEKVKLGEVTYFVEK